MGPPNIEGKMIKGEIVAKIPLYYKDMTFDEFIESHDVDIGGCEDPDDKIELKFRK